MKRKRFVKLAMSQRCSKREAEYIADYSRYAWGSYQDAYDDMCGYLGGRFGEYVGKVAIPKYVFAKPKISYKRTIC